MILYTFMVILKERIENVIQDREAAVRNNLMKSKVSTNINVLLIYLFLKCI